MDSFAPNPYGMYLYTLTACGVANTTKLCYYVCENNGDSQEINVILFIRSHFVHCMNNWTTSPVAA